MADIEVIDTHKKGGLEFLVRVREGESSTEHRVTMAESQFEKLGHGAIEPNELIRAAFKFLLERESKESIMSQFDVSVISRYFPEFESQLEKYF